MDQYTRVKNIGEGAYGKAILCRHMGSQKLYVIKEINILRVGHPVSIVVDLLLKSVFGHGNLVASGRMLVQLEIPWGLEGTRKDGGGPEGVKAKRNDLQTPCIPFPDGWLSLPVLSLDGRERAGRSP